MKKQLLHRLLLLVFCGALLIMVAALPKDAPDEEICNDTVPKQDVPGGQLLWESLSHHLVSSVQY
jgi:hypothetical protein